MFQSKKNQLFCKNTFYIILLFTGFLFMSIGYASINAVSLNLTAALDIEKQNNVFITEVNYKESLNADANNSKINTATQTLLNSNIVLSDTDENSYITYTITVYNSAKEEYMFVGSFYDEEFYSNTNIIFEHSSLRFGDTIASGDYLSFDVTFKYNSDVVPTNSINSLTSNIDFRFELLNITETLSGIEFNYLIKNGVYAPEGDVYEYYDVDANRLVDHTVRKIVFGKKVDYMDAVSNLTAEPIDVYRTGSISLYRQLESDGKYTIYILSDSGKFILNENANWMFDKLYDLEEIVNLHILDTSNVVYMRDMFCDCASLKTVDLSNFNTSKVTNMIGMFARMYAIEYLDLTTFDTSNVEEIGQMFTSNSALKKIYVSNKWVITDKITAENGAGLFTSCTSLVGGNGTVLGTDVTYKMAVADTASTTGYLTLEYELLSGTEFNHIIKNLSQEEIDAWALENRYLNYDVTSITFGTTRTYYDIASSNTGIAVDNDRSGVIKSYRVSNGDGTYSVYIISNNGIFNFNEDANWMFDGLVFLKKINNLNLVNTSNVVNMRDIFCDCQYLTEIDLSSFDTSNVVTLEGMFARMYSIEILDLSSFNTKNVTTLKNTFYLGISANYTYADLMDCIPALKTIYVSDNWNISKVDMTIAAFSNNTNLVGGNGTKFDSNYTLPNYAVIDTTSTKGYLTKK